MSADKQPPAEITHPDTGQKMVLDTTQGTAAIRHKLERNIGIAQGGAEVLSRIREKEQNEGYIYRDPVTGYTSRINPSSDQGAKPADQGAAASSPAAEQGGDRDARVRALRAELASLEQQ